MCEESKTATFSFITFIHHLAIFPTFTHSGIKNIFQRIKLPNLKNKNRDTVLTLLSLCMYNDNKWLFCSILFFLKIRHLNSVILAAIGMLQLSKVINKLIEKSSEGYH